jgi:RND family efflux transporter MFP subunit
MRLLRRLLPLVVLLVFVLVALAINRFLHRPPRVDVAEVKRETVERVLAVTGRLRPAQRNQVYPLVAGRLVELRLAEGDAVKRGAVLARVDDTAARAALAQAEARAAAQASTVAQTRRDLERVTVLHAQGLLTDQQFEQSRQSAEDAVATATALREAAREARARLDDHVLRSPSDGYVLERPVDPGQDVTPQTLVYEVATARDPLVEADIDEQFLGELKVGMPATVAPLTGRRVALAAVVSYIGRKVETSSGAVVVRLRFREPPPALPAGLSLDVNLFIERHPDALTVPRRAVSGLGLEPWVLVIDGDHAVKRTVDIIDWPSERVVVRRGLEPGTRVVLDPRKVPAGAAVRPRLAPDGL